MALSSHVRPMEASDASTVLLLARSLDKWFNAEGLAQMAKDFQAHEGFVAVDGARVVGFVTWNPVGERIANLSWMGVEESLHRRGIGRQLLHRLLPELRRRGFRTLEVSTVADSLEYEPYAATRRFYRALGFEDFRVDARYFGQGDDRYDRLILRLDLAPRR